MTPNDIIKIACEDYSITPEEFFSPSHCEWFVRARRHTAILMRDGLKMSAGEIGYFLHKDRSTIIYYFKDNKKTALVR